MMHGASERLFRRRETGALLALVAAALFGACGGLPDSCPRGRAVADVEALDATTVAVTFACRIDSGSAALSAHYDVGNFWVVPPQTIGVSGAVVVAEDRVELTTGEQVGGVNYTLRVDGVKDADGATLVASANFVGAGAGNTAQVTFRVDDRYNATLQQVWLLLSVDPLTGRFSSAQNRFALADADADHVFEGVLAVEVDPTRTADTADDTLGPEYRGYAVRAVDADNRPLSELVVFEVPDSSARVVEVPLLTVPPPPPPEGLVDVTFEVDDRPARALSSPVLRGSFDADGVFDADFPSTVALSDPDGDHIWTGSAKVRIAPDRVIGGTEPATQPYSVYIVESGTPYGGRSADFVIPDETAVSVELLLGNPDKTPVTFRVDVGHAWLDLDGAHKGLWPGESVFLTGEFGEAEDAFGQNAADAFSGGENAVLEMKPRADRPTIWERTIFLPRNRPYGWKVVRCPAGVGCSELNKKVVSSGRAFPTVMKNLVTEQCDADKESWSDPNCQSPKVADPRELAAVDTGSGVLDYSGAAIYAGGGGGGTETDPAGTPTATLMFKQEVPDLVVHVADQPVETPVYVVGTWRDVNIPGTPFDIIAGSATIDLADTDYDAGFVGAEPPSFVLPPPPPPMPYQLDGALDAVATLVAGGSGRMALHVAIDGDWLYLATDDGGEGSDHFLLVSDAPPGSAVPAPWGKAGTVAFAGTTLFLADENDGDFCGWFELGAPDVLLVDGAGQHADLGVATGPNGGVLEGAINLAAIFGAVPDKIYIAAGPWGTSDGGALYSSAQVPATVDSDGDIDADEILTVLLPSLQVQP